MDSSQRDLFTTQPEPWELDDQEERRVAQVVFIEGVDGRFDYLVPDRLSDRVRPGVRLKVPLGRGNRTVLAFCVDVSFRRIRRALKDVVDVLDAAPLLSKQMLELTEWMARYYVCRWGRVIEAVIPAGVKTSVGTREKVFLSVDDVTIARLDDLKLPPKQAHVMRRLTEARKPLTVDELTERCDCTVAPVNALRKKGLVKEERHRVAAERKTQPERAKEQHLVLNSQQEKVLTSIVKAIESDQPERFLLHGVTGSGKTEVYIQAIDQVIAAGKQAIVLVPEISLTPQTKQRFESRFDHVAVLHSHLSDVDRSFHWRNIAKGDVQVVVGARSALFAPTPRLGLIVLDEEHDGSFKQSQEPRYHARTVAEQRAKLENCPLVLGSATPSLESWQKALAGEYTLLSMPERVSRLPLPQVATIDMREEQRGRFHRGGIGFHLEEAMKKTLREGGQVILLLNRRGFSTHIQCPACGEVAKCKECDIALTHHRDGEKVVCHYCDFETTTPRSCSACGFENIRFGGLGTQKLEFEIRGKFPKYECLRMDSDTMKRPGSHAAAFARFRSGEVKILLGTQMISKGLDFPNVTLVGVINADTGLHMPDFRAGERAFQLITQVAGRTGRSERGGRVLVQSYNPDHPSIQAAKRHDFLTFANAELSQRKTFGYPPFASLARIIVRGASEERTGETARTIGEHIRTIICPSATEQPLEEVRILGPAPAPIAKLRGEYRFHMIIQTKDLEPVREALQSAKKNIPLDDDIRWIVDIDAIEML